MTRFMMAAGAAALATIAFVTPSWADEQGFGYENPRDCLKASPSGVCRTVDSEMSLNDLLRQLTGVTLEEVAADNQVPVETLRNGEIILRPGLYFAT
jgi:hypothetical protein